MLIHLGFAKTTARIVKKTAMIWHDIDHAHNAYNKKAGLDIQSAIHTHYIYNIFYNLETDYTRNEQMTYKIALE